MSRRDFYLLGRERQRQRRHHNPSTPLGCRETRTIVGVSYWQIESHRNVACRSHDCWVRVGNRRSCLQQQIAAATNHVVINLLRQGDLHRHFPIGLIYAAPKCDRGSNVRIFLGLHVGEGLPNIEVHVGEIAERMLLVGVLRRRTFIALVRSQHDILLRVSCI